MSFKVSNILQFPQSTLQYSLQDECDVAVTKGLPLLGGILSDTRYIWHAKGPCLEVRNTKTGIKIGAWTFGCILKDSNTRIICVEEIQRMNGMLSLLAIGLECAISGGLICVFDIFGSKVIRAIQIKDKITSLHVVDSGCEVLNLPGPLRNFDGIISVGTEGGNVFLVDICRQICEEALHSTTVRDELCPCHLILLTVKDIPKIEYYKERSVREGDHLAIHLNVVLNSSTHHFTLKGPKGDDRIFVNKEEVVTSALYYCSQLTSLLVGFNFGAFQLWDLTSLNLVYTSPVCEEHLPITRFALQEPADDPRAFCYIWASYSNMELFHSGLPFAVMYSLCYESKEYHEGYGYLYQDFQSCSIRFQVELGPLEEHKTGSKVRGGLCTALQPVCKFPANKDLYSLDVTGDILAVCLISWTLWFNYTETCTYMLLFDLNQWYKEQMPDFTKWSDCSNYILKSSITDLVTIAGRKAGPLLDVKVDKKSLRQFSGVQRLEEHFYPSSLSFNLWGLRENDVILLHNEGLQRALLNQVEAAGPLCLIRPSDVYRHIIALGLTPLFTDPVPQISASTDTQREIILNVALEHQLVGWLCKCASEWANGSFSSAGCSLDFLIGWAFQRAIVLKTHCDNYCTPLFDYSQLRLDNNTSILLNNCIRQINNLSVFYTYILTKLSGFIVNLDLVLEQQTSLKMVSIYFEVLQWLVNVGLLPESHPSLYPKVPNTAKVSAPYPVQELTEFYNKKRAQLQMLTKETFISSDSLLFIDNLVNNKCGAELLQKQWQDDGGSGLYPPPSLQSLLRTYLIEGADISHKHSLIIYVFLDLAMALDQSRYASVITHLIKFPAVFKMSSSIIKITQAFWQLDHGDFTTAMEQLLDPLVLADDLQPWHHAIAMRSLLLQDQYNFALLYMQVRKPPITSEKDVLTAISLFVANNMLDEAFYFMNQHQNNNEEILLTHLFNECNKNESLHLLLYRCLNTSEERAFFKYLKSVQNPTSDDLQVFYYLLRSRFVEAFDAHQSSKRKKPECQGLVGQRKATKTDQIVRIFKTLLPDVNKNLLDVIRTERANLWKEVERPTPLSVFVHNTNEQVQYKSTVIHAALAKAKHTFNDTPVKKPSREIVTEETPFLRTPKVSRMSSSYPTPVITPKIIELNESGEELSPSPSKRLKLTPRASASSPAQIRSTSIHAKMLTPIVKRKTSLQKDETLLSNSSLNVCTPQSILKVRNLVRHNDTISDDTRIDEMLQDQEGLTRIESSPRKSGLGLLPRKSFSKSLRKTHVKFDDAIRLSSSFSDQSIKPSLNSTPLENLSADKSTLSSKDVSLMMSKNSSTSNTDDVFYSPNSSLNDSGEKDESTVNIEPNVVEDDTVESEVIKKSVSEDIACHLSLTQSPRARRSYKRSIGETVPVRYSPRISRHSSKETQMEPEITITTDTSIASNEVKDESDMDSTHKQFSTSSETNTSNIESPVTKNTPRLLQKVRGRKSLTRQVLEHNTFSKVLSSPSVHDSNIIVTREMSYSKVEKNVVIEKTGNSSEITTKETKEEISTLSDNSVNSRRHSKRDSLHKEYVSELNAESDLSLELEFSFSSPVLPENLKMSDSLVEYIKSRTSKPDFENVLAESTEAHDEQPDVVNAPEDVQKITVEDDSQRNDDKPEPMEVYEDLSSGAEDIKEVLMESQLQSETYVEVCTENVFDELENNIFETSSVVQQTMERETVEDNLEKPSKRTSLFDSFSRYSDNSYIPEAEKGFLGDYSKIEISALSAESDVPECDKAFVGNNESSNRGGDVIEIGSSSDERESSKDAQSDSSYSRRSDSDDGVLNISYERNIHVEENSRSLVDSEDSGTSDDSLANDDIHLEPAQIVMEPVEDLNNDDELEMNADSNSVEWVNDENQHSDENNEHAEDEEEILAAEDNGTDNEIEDINVELQQFLEQNETNDVPEELNMSDKSEVIRDSEECHVVGEQIQEEETEKSEVDPQQKNSETISENKPEETLNKVDEENTPSEERPKKSHLDEKQELNEGTTEKDIQATDNVIITQENVSSKEQLVIDTPNGDQKSSVSKDEIKVDQSTNTTMFASVNSEKSDTDTSSKNQENKFEKKVKVDQSTNTTVLIPEKNATASKTNDSFVEVNRPKERRVYHPRSGTMKIVTEDQTLSSVSSDTTEGEIVKQELVVVVDVHTTTKKDADEPPTKRVTRRSSGIFSQTAETTTSTEPNVSSRGSEVMEKDSELKSPKKGDTVDDDSEDAFLADARSRRSRSMTASPSRLSKSLRSSHLESTELTRPNTSTNTKKDTQPRLRKTRSVSVDEVVASPRRRSLRRSSVDEKFEDSPEIHKPKTRGKAASVSQLPVITEEVKNNGKSSVRGKTSMAEDYTTARRLTRRQASLIKGIETPSSVTAQDDSDVEAAIDVDTIDPIKLLDKEPFHGPPDPEEDKIYEPSSPSNSTTSSFNKPTKRASRSASMASDSSAPCTTPKKRTKQSLTNMESPSPKGVKTRSRKQSETSSVASEKSDPPTPPKRSKKNLKDTDETNSAASAPVSTRSTRSRSNSVNSDILSSPKRKPRGRRLVSAKSDLPEIMEEKGSDAASEKKATGKKSTRKKSS